MDVTPNSWARITALFDEYQALSPTDREVRLATLARSEPTIAAEVVSLLNADNSAEEAFLATRSGTAFVRPAAPGPRLVGRTLGAYRVEGEIGRGGMGVVYEGRHVDPTLQKRVAIKTLSIGLDRPELAWRFRRERQILAKLDHPHIAALYDGGTTDDGVPYLVMEYVDGVRLDTWCDSKSLTIPQRLDLFRQVCSAVQFAHGKLVVHRDLKPSNVLVTSDGVVKLLDFGIAKLSAADDELSEAEELTRAGAAPLTTAYASPEQFRGDEVTTASDIYSLGVMLYRLLAGRSPYALDGLTPSAARDLISGTPVRAPSESVTHTQPSQCRLPDVSSLRDRLRGELDAIVLMAMRAEPTRRYASAEALSEDLLRYLKGMPVNARPDTVRYRLRKFARRERALVTGVGIAMIALVGGTLAAVQSARVANAELLRTTRMTSVLKEIIGAGTTSKSNYSSVPTMLTVLDSARSSVAREFAADPRTRADFYATFGQSYVSFDRPDLSLAVFDSALLLHTRTLGKDAPEVAYDLLGSADALDAVGRPDSANTRRAAAVVALRQLRPVPEDVLTAAELLLAGGMIASMINEDKALPMLMAALARARATPAPQWGTIARYEATSIMPYLRQRGEAAADSAYERSMDALRRDSTNSEDGRYALAFQVQAQGYRGRSAEAIASARLLVDKTAQRLGPTHILVAQAQNLLAGNLGAVNRTVEARALFDSAIVIAESHPTSDPMAVADMYAGRAMVEVRAHDARAVTASLERVRLLTLKMGAQRPVAEMTIERIASTMDVDQANFASARRHLVRAVEIGREKLGPTATRTVAAEDRLKKFDAERAASAPKPLR
jgi:serine/threonine protein kinase